MPAHICVRALSLYPLTLQFVSNPIFTALHSTSPFSSSPFHLSAITPSIHVFRRTDVSCRFVVGFWDDYFAQWEVALAMLCLQFEVLFVSSDDVKMNVMMVGCIQMHWPLVTSSHASVCMPPRPCLPHSTFSKWPFTPISCTCCMPKNWSWDSFSFQCQKKKQKKKKAEMFWKADPECVCELINPFSKTLISPLISKLHFVLKCTLLPQRNSEPDVALNLYYFHSSVEHRKRYLAILTIKG